MKIKSGFFYYGEISRFENMMPDEVIDIDGYIPCDDFAICRDKDGKTTARYGSNEWDLNPYNTAAKNISILRFDVNDIKGINSDYYDELISEFKYIMFSLIYYGHKGFSGYLTVTTIRQRFDSLKISFRYLLEIKKNKFARALKLRDLFTQEKLLFPFVKYLNLYWGESRSYNVTCLLSSLSKIGVDKLGFEPLLLNRYRSHEYKQHPVIPPRIYLSFVNKSIERLSYLENELELIDDFIYEMKDKSQFYTHDKIGHETRGLLGINRLKTFEQLAKDYSLFDFFTKYNRTKNSLNRSSLMRCLNEVQQELKLIIHLFTGMRDQEVARLEIDCIVSKMITASISFDNEILLPSKMVDVISTTTKYTGREQKTSWLAPEEVKIAVRILKKIASGIAKLNDVELGGCRLLVSASNIRHQKKHFSNTVSGAVLLTECHFLQMEEYIITNDDFKCLCATDPSRDFSSEKDFKIGKTWKFTSHQFRRSLAYYATNSGFVSFPSLKRQFKHHLVEIAKYYSKNFDKLPSIFGCFDENLNSFILPDSHIALKVQGGIPVAVAETIMQEVFNKEMIFYGKAGGYIEQKKHSCKTQHVSIDKIKVETIKKAQRGEISYTKTLLGGCTKTGGCDCALLGEVTACINSECAIIHREKLDETIEEVQQSLSLFETSTGEYQSLNSELEQLLRFKFKIDREM